jgi:sugar-specific transcriptional regulator TrmB
MKFSDIGLTPRDKRVYEALISEPEASVRKLAETTGINRGSVFESLKDLVAAGLVTHTISGKRLKYRAKDPDVIHEIINEKLHTLKHAHSDVDEYIAQLGDIAQDPGRFHFASFYADDEGLAAILRDVLKTCRRSNITEYRVISSPRVSKYLYNNFTHFTSERIAQKLNVSILRQGSILGEGAEYSESRFIPGDRNDTGCYTIIYGIKVAIITINEYNQTSGVIIDNNDFATVQRHLFDASWQLASLR